MAVCRPGGSGSVLTRLVLWSAARLPDGGSDQRLRAAGAARERPAPVQPGRPVGGGDPAAPAAAPGRLHHPSGWSLPVHASGGGLRCAVMLWCVQVVFLYERSGNYVWHGPLRLGGAMDRTFAPFTLLDYGRHAGAYDRSVSVMSELLPLLMLVMPAVPLQSLILVPLPPQARTGPHGPGRPGRSSPSEHQPLPAAAARRSFPGVPVSRSPPLPAGLCWAGAGPSAQNLSERGLCVQLYPDDASAAALDFRRKAKALLHLATQTLGSLRVPFWISSGTCLGKPPQSTAPTAETCRSLTPPACRPLQDGSGSAASSPTVRTWTSGSSSQTSVRTSSAPSETPA